MRFLTSAGSAAAGGSDQSVDPSLLNDIGTALSQMDILSCGLNGVLTQLRGGVPGDGTSTAPEASGRRPSSLCDPASCAWFAFGWSTVSASSSISAAPTRPPRPKATWYPTR